jgi:antitoxin component of RelBE/YafQ-DinJ toxin-antitoxin module
MRKHLAAATVAVASVAGLGAGFALGSPNLVGAQTSSSSTTTATTAPATTDPAKPAARVNPVDDALAKLVKDGTITQTQADAVKKAIQDARPAGGPGGRGHGPRGGMGGFGLAEGKSVVDAAAKALGITSDDLMQQVMNGTTVAKIAESKNIPLNTVVDAAVKEITTKIDAAVTAGTMTQAQADKIKTNLTQTVTDFANGKMPFGRGGMPGMRGGKGGHGGGNDNDADDQPGAPAAPTTPPTTKA